MIYPYLRYRDAAAAIDWLERAFGFRRDLVVEDEDGGIAHAQLSLGDGVVMLATAGGSADERSPLDLPAVSGGIYVYVEVVEAHYERARAAGAEVLRELQAMEYGSREYSVTDLEGHHWSFGTYRPGDE